MPIFNANGEEIKATAPAGAGENVQEAAAPAEDGSAGEAEPSSVTETASDTQTAAGNASAGENAQEAAAPAAETNAEDTPAENAPQSRAENRKQAASRRAREIESAKATATSEMLQALGLEDPTTGKPVTTKEDFDAYIAHRDAGRSDEQLRRAGIDPDTIREVLADAPMVKAAEEAIEAAHAAEAQASRRAEGLSLDAAIAEITRLNPEVKSFDDLYALPEYGDIKRLVGAGYSFGRAYEMAAVDRTRANARQSAYNAVASKAHLTGTARAAGNAYTISDAQFENYKQLHPNATRAEATAAYRKFGKKGK